MFENDRVFCVNAWQSLRIEPGKVRWCEASQESFQISHPLVWWKKGAETQTLRSNIQQGIQVPGCSRCYSSERIDGNSFRLNRNKESQIVSGPLFDKTLSRNPRRNLFSETELEANPAILTVSFSNECNSRCIMCDAQSSHLVAWDIKGRDGDAVVTKIDQDHVVDIYETLNDLQELDINGGEPWLQPEVIELLTQLKNQGRTDIKISLHTNCTLRNEALIEILKSFSNLRLGLSIETMHVSNDYIRAGSNISQIRSNIEYIRKSLPTANIYAHCVPQALSIFYIDTLFDYCLENGLSLVGNPLHRPSYMSIPVLPHYLRRRIASVLRNKYSINPENHVEFSVHAVLQKILEWLDVTSHPSDVVQQQMLMEKIIAHDELTGMDHRDYYPQLKINALK